MEAKSKQSAASATASEPNIFQWARLKLTGIYVLILAIILLGFSLLLYQSLQRNLIDASEEDFSGIESHHHFIDNTLASVRNEIMLIDLIVLLVAAGASYVLAGYTLRPIEQSVEAQRIFSENASHELRTPLAVMRNDTEVLLRNPHPTPEHIRSILQSNVEEMTRMSGIVEELLTLARSTNVLKTSFEEVDLSEVGVKMVNKIKHLAKEKGVSLTASDAKPLLVQGHTLTLERAILNILQNALEHTPHGGSVSLESFKDENEAVIKITDTGSGIEEKDMPHIFERFYKTVASNGSGLGLSIVQEIMTQHDGRVEIESQKGKGTTVSLRLPLV